MSPLRSIIVLLAFGLLIQNTCPHGFAGKTSVTAKCTQCTLKQHHSLSPDGQKKITANSPSVHFPLFVFAVPKTINTFRFDPIKSARLILDDQYKDALPNGLLRPPHA
ncbi:MAG: hypothetical protein ACM3MD_07305 [Betaproteobacteria bacterium]